MENDRQSCPLCASPNIFQFFNRDSVPTKLNFVFSQPEEARSLKKASLKMALCEDCGFIFNKSFSHFPLHYDLSYDNTQSCSEYFDTYLDQEVENILSGFESEKCFILEIGCGKGDFLKKLLNKNKNAIGWGFDPSCPGLESEMGGRLHFKPYYYDATCITPSPDIILCRHVIGHIPEPLLFLKIIRNALENSPHAHVFFETPSAEWIFEKSSIWDFFYEYCSIFTASSLRIAFERTGFKVDSIKSIFDGQYFWLEAHPVSQKRIFPLSSYVQTYAEKEVELRKKWFNTLCELRARGKVAVWGAGAKGVTFANLLDPDCTLIECIVDINPNKQGKFLPGTGHPIINPQDLVHHNVTTAIVMNIIYLNEIKNILKQFNISIDLIEGNKG